MTFKFIEMRLYFKELANHFLIDLRKYSNILRYLVFEL